MAFLAVMISSGCVSNSSTENKIPYQNLTTDDIKNQSEDVIYRELLRNPDDYRGDIVHVEGYVSNSFSYQNSMEYLITEEDISTDFISISLYADYIRNNLTTVNASSERIIEDDYLEVWGVFDGVETRESQILGRSVENEYALITARHVDHSSRN